MTGRVYFLECAGRIKVGYSANVEERRKELSTGAPAELVLIGQIPGNRQDEQIIHRYLSVFRGNGEWFNDCKPVRKCIESLLADRPKALADIHEAVKAKRHPELRAALAKIVEPITLEESTRDIIRRAAAKAGLSFWRTFDIWYGKARRIDIIEARAIQQALVSHMAARADRYVRE